MVRIPSDKIHDKSQAEAQAYDEKKKAPEVIMSGFIYKSKFYKNFFIRKYIRINCWLANRLDSAKDKKICGVSLVKYVPSEFRESMGATGSQSTRYWMLDAMLRGEKFTENDSLFDVGCGKGRVLYGRHITRRHLLRNSQNRFCRRKPRMISTRIRFCFRDQYISGLPMPTGKN